MTYDENGNLTSVTNSCGTTTFAWDGRNRLVAINGFTSALASSSACAPLAASFKYDALGRRIEKTVNGRTIQYLYDGVDIVQEIENGAVSSNYLRTLNIDEPLARLTPNSSRFYQTDALRSVVALTDETGAIKTQFVYDPFGNVAISGEPSDNPFQYTGRENDGMGLYYYRARYYSPELQRFISEDPIGFEGGDANFYAYVANNPMKWFDPEGKYVWPYTIKGWLALGGVLVGGAVIVAFDAPIIVAGGAVLVVAGAGYLIYESLSGTEEAIRDTEKKMVPLKKEKEEMDKALKKLEGDDQNKPRKGDCDGKNK
jgi:RHS repeat-associated protein